MTPGTMKDYWNASFRFYQFSSKFFNTLSITVLLTIESNTNSVTSIVNFFRKLICLIVFEGFWRFTLGCFAFVPMLYPSGSSPRKLHSGKFTSWKFEHKNFSNALYPQFFMQKCYLSNFHRSLSKAKNCKV